MRVWIVNHYAYAPFHSAGTRHYSLARELIKRGHEVLIISTSFYHKARQETRLQPGEVWKRELIDGVPFLWLRTPPYSGNTLARLWNMLVFTIRVWKEVGISQEKKPDVIIGSSPHLFAAWAAERLSRRYCIPFILEVRDIWPETLIELGNLSANHPLIWLMTKLEHYLYQRANIILTLLPGAVKYLKQKGANKQTIIWLPNGIDLENYFESIPVIQNKIFTLLYAGAHGIANGLDSILESAYILQCEGWSEHIHIYFIGDGAEKLKLQKTAMERKLHNVVFESALPKNKIYERLSQADAFVVTMKRSQLYRHGISFNKIYDYLAMSRPIVFGVEAFNNPVEEAKAGISVPPENPQAMANAIKTLAEMPLEERIAMGTRGREYVKKYHSFENLAKKLEKVLLDVIA